MGTPKPTTKPTPKPTPKPTETTPKPAPKPTPKPGALKCHKCNAVPNPGNPHPDACDATEHFGPLTDCSLDFPNPGGALYCQVTHLTEGNASIGSGYQRGCLDFSQAHGKIPKPGSHGVSCANYSISGGKAQVSVCICNHDGCNELLGDFSSATFEHPTTAILIASFVILYFSKLPIVFV